jgi:FMN phosphatase YigB (HAD superfamily)
MCGELSGIKSKAMNKMNVKAILFDVGGTLYVSKEFDKQFSLQIEKLLAERLKIPLEEARSCLKVKKEELLKKENDPSKVRAMAAFGISRSEVHEAFCKVNPGLYLNPSRAVNDMLKNLHGKGYKLAILSNFRKILVEQIMDCLDIDLNVFDFLITEDDGLPIKPAQDPFIESLKRFSLEAKNVAYVGDDLSKDMVPAKAVEMRTIWVNPKPAEGPLPDAVDIIIKDVLKLNDIFC